MISWNSAGVGAGSAAKTPHTIRIPLNFVSSFVAFLDAVVLITVGMITFEAYTRWTNAGWADEQYSLYLSIIMINTLATTIALNFSKLYRFRTIVRPGKHAPRIFLIGLVIFSLMLALAFGLKISSSFSRGWVFLWGASNPVALFIIRLFIGKLLRGSVLQEHMQRNVAVVGGGKQAAQLVTLLEANSDDAGIHLVGVFDQRSAGREADQFSSASAGCLDDLIALTRNNQVDEILIALPWTANERILQVVDKLQQLPVAIRLSPDVAGLNFRYHSYTHYNGVPALNLAEKPLSDLDTFLKRCFDFTASLLLLIALSPLMLIIAVLVKMSSPGDILFRQKRPGFNNQLFNVLKFRTLHTLEQDQTGGKMIKRNDPRVTVIGKFLRRSSLDELPQLINVLRGEMSLVGPRPHPVEATAAGVPYDMVVSRYGVRHKVKPGMTGWAQINGWRGETDTAEKISKRVEFDIHYINNWSLLSDLKILIKTIPAIVIGKGAF